MTHANEAFAGPGLSDFEMVASSSVPAIVATVRRLSDCVANNLGRENA